MRFHLFDTYSHELFCEISNRHGGVSQKPYDTLNLALHVGDDPINVLKNRTILSEEYHFILENLIYMDQTHSDNIHIVEDTAINKIENCDAIITNQRNIPLMVMVADCVPMLFFDPQKKVIGAVHAGRNGTFKKIASKVVHKMQTHYGCNPQEILVALGPSIGVCCYEVGEEIADIAQKSFGQEYLQKRENRYYLNLPKLNINQLKEAGVLAKHIETAPICTCCTPHYFSYRREGLTGRFAGVIKLK